MHAGRELASRDRCAWHRCRGPIQRQRATRRYCSAALPHGCPSLRPLCPPSARLYGRAVGPAARRRTFILRHEALGTTGNVRLWFGLRHPRGHLLSVVGFGHGPHAAGGDIVLERGATRRRAPHNAASYLISRALRFGRRHLGWQQIKAFSDPRFGEAGLVYKAVGFRAMPAIEAQDAMALRPGRRQPGALLTAPSIASTGLMPLREPSALPSCACHRGKPGSWCYEQSDCCQSQARQRATVGCRAHHSRHPSDRPFWGILRARVSWMAFASREGRAVGIPAPRGARQRHCPRPVAAVRAGTA